MPKLIPKQPPYAPPARLMPRYDRLRRHAKWVKGRWSALHAKQMKGRWRAIPSAAVRAILAAAAKDLLLGLQQLLQSADGVAGAHDAPAPSVAALNIRNDRLQRYCSALDSDDSDASPSPTTPGVSPSPSPSHGNS